jgi:DNA-binding XRE family transcriptional regulator
MEKDQPRFPNLQAEMARAGLTIKDIAKFLGLSVQSVGARFAGSLDWKLTEMLKLRTRFNATLDYLFYQEVNAA